VRHPTYLLNIYTRLSRSPRWCTQLLVFSNPKFRTVRLSDSDLTLSAIPLSPSILPVRLQLDHWLAIDLASFCCLYVVHIGFQPSIQYLGRVTSPAIPCPAIRYSPSRNTGAISLLETGKPYQHQRFHFPDSNKCGHLHSRPTSRTCTPKPLQQHPLP
jgi:hypothetical protein